MYKGVEHNSWHWSHCQNKKETDFIPAVMQLFKSSLTLYQPAERQNTDDKSSELPTQRNELRKQTAKTFYLNSQTFPWTKKCDSLACMRENVRSVIKHSNDVSFGFSPRFPDGL